MKVKAVFCDRCGNSVGFVKGIQTTVDIDSNNNRRVIMYFDLCKDCRKLFVDWINFKGCGTKFDYEELFGDAYIGGALDEMSGRNRD